MSDLTCAEPGCDQAGIVPVTPATDPPTYKCFAHMGITLADDGTATAAEPAPVFAPDIANLLAADLLEAASVSMVDDAEVIDGVFATLVETTGMERSFAAAIMLALSMVISAGQLPADDVRSLAGTLRDNAADAEWQDQDPPPPAGAVSPVLAGLGSDESGEAGTDAAHVCGVCEGTGRVYANEIGDDEGPCPRCDGNGYLPEPSGPAHDPINDNEGSDDDN